MANRGKYLTARPGGLELLTEDDPVPKALMTMQSQLMQNQEEMVSYINACLKKQQDLVQKMCAAAQNQNQYQEDVDTTMSDADSKNSTRKSFPAVHVAAGSSGQPDELIRAEPTPISQCATIPSDSGAEQERTSSQGVDRGESQQSFTAPIKPDAEVKEHKVKRQASMLSGNRRKDFYSVMVRNCWDLQDRLGLSEVQEPVRSGPLNRLVSSPCFDNLAAAVIMFNSIFVMYTSNYEMAHLGEPMPDSIVMVEAFFIAFYTAEIILRIANHRWYFFVNKDCRWNWIDLILVLASLYEELTTLVADSSQGNVATMRMIRMLKLLKIGRTLKVVRVFRDLQLIVKSFINSIVPLFWCFVFLMFVVYFFSLVMVQGMVGTLSLEREPSHHPDYADIMMFFGSVQTTMLSLYMAVTGGNDWSMYYDVAGKAGDFYAFAFLFYTFFFVFSIVNILTSVFVEKVVVAAEPDRAAIILDQRRKLIKESQELKHLFHLLDTDGEGTISKAEFQDNLQNELIYSYMSSIGLEVHDMALFFDMVAASSDTGHIEIDKFVEGCMNMRGQASSVDMQRQLLLQQSLQDKVLKIQNDTRKLDEITLMVKDIFHLQQGSTTTGGTPDPASVEHCTNRPLDKVDADHYFPDHVLIPGTDLAI